MAWPGRSGPAYARRQPAKAYPWATVVAVAADVKLGARDEPAGDQWYVPVEQPAVLYGPDSAGKLTDPAGEYVVIRSALPPQQMEQILRSTVAQIDPLLALQHVQTMEDEVSTIEAPRRFNTGLVTAFAILALLLAAIGIYATVAFSISLRTQEIAIRMALGAQRIGIARLVLSAGLKLALLGCGLGILGAVALSRLLGSFLFGVSATDPLVYVSSVLTMVLLALLASVIPATRAASADPVQALRSA